MSLIVSAGSLMGCHKKADKTADKPAGSATGKATEPALQDDAGITSDSTKQALDGLTPQVDALKERFSALGKQIEKLPADLHGYDDLRTRFYQVTEGMGIMGPKLTWLSSRLDAAQKSGKREDLVAVSNDISKTYAELGEISKISLDLLHRYVQLRDVAGDTLFTHVLPGGYGVKAAENGVEQDLIEFIEDAKTKPDPTSWFEFDRVVFAAASAKLDAEPSKAQLQNVVEILKAYPKVTLKLGGYLDDAGAPATNKKLPLERGQALKSELVRLGAAASRLDADRTGVPQPSCTATGPHGCPSKAGHVAARVTAK